ncbi:YdcF family protein [Shewanella yunxiaonensis]|uniref:YdcF family protein n=1 Tax=Shewanella yunxiaonensis TaxID=2829809 RepID=A0ABX7YW97_9GAMM|nr:MULTISPECIES: YdcF family protein [Shewanella]MDF0535682.1 YdcF family protein [Shewanella sp. A32]QUN06959.1 YdcF family protein [Shewanella yunxiaonensis]
MFLIKNLISQLFMPIPLAVILLLLALWFWRRKPKLAKGLVLVSMTWLLLLSSSFGSYWLLWPLEQQYAVRTDTPKHASVVMVLGSGHDDAIVGEARHKLSTTALARLTEGVAQVKKANSPDCLLVVSGWTGGINSTSHAQQMHDAAVDMGANAERILELSDARDTIEEALALRKAFGASATDMGEDAVGGRQLVLVTSAAHMPRAMKIFKMAGMDPVAAPTDFLARRDHWWRFSTENLNKSAKAIHEYLGMTWLSIRIMLGM